MNVYKIRSVLIILIFVIAVTTIMIFWPDDTEQFTIEKTTDTNKGTVSSARLLYQKALALKQKSENLSIEDHKQILEYRRQIIKQFPDSTEAEKANALMSELYEQYQKQYANQVRAVHYSQLKM